MLYTQYTLDPIEISADNWMIQIRAVLWASDFGLFGLGYPNRISESDSFGSNVLGVQLNSRALKHLQQKCEVSVAEQPSWCSRRRRSRIVTLCPFISN